MFDGFGSVSSVYGYAGLWHQLHVESDSPKIILDDLGVGKDCFCEIYIKA